MPPHAPEDQLELYARSIRRVPGLSDHEDRLITVDLSAKDRDQLQRFYSDPGLNVMGTDLDGGWWKLNSLDRDGYANTPFLDHRSLRFSRPQYGTILVMPEILRGLYRHVDPAETKFMTVFHVGHCGSTILSNLLGQCPEIFVLREPPVLRWLMRQRVEKQEMLANTEWVSVIGSILTRRFEPGVTPVVKATSWCHGLMEPILRLHPENHALFLYSGLREYIVRSFGGRAGDMEKSSRRSFLQLVSALPESLRDWGKLERWQRATLGWVAKVHSVDIAVREGLGDRVKVLSYGDLLHDPATTMGDALGHLDISRTPAEIEALVKSGLWSRYAKDQDLPFDIEQECENLQRLEGSVKQEVASSLRFADELIEAGILSESWRRGVREACWDTQNEGSDA